MTVMRELRRKGVSLYDHSDAVHLAELFPEDFRDSLALDTRDPERRRKRVSAVFLRFLELVIDDCIAHGNKFMFPTVRPIYLYVCEKGPISTGRAFRQRNVYRNVNIFKSDGKVYELVLHFVELKKKRAIRISYAKYQEIVARVNAGQRYWSR